MDAFDADVLIYAASATHSLGHRVARLFSPTHTDRLAGVGSTLLLPELMAKPLRIGAETEAAALAHLLAQLELLPVDRVTADHATALAAKYKLRTVDATHLATAIGVGATRFITNNLKDFPKSITEVDVVYPSELPDR